MSPEKGPLRGKVPDHHLAARARQSPDKKQRRTLPAVAYTPHTIFCPADTFFAVLTDEGMGRGGALVTWLVSSSPKTGILVCSLPQRRSPVCLFASA
jgi:hypothetical protein